MQTDTKNSEQPYHENSSATSWSDATRWRLVEGGKLLGKNLIDIRTQHDSQLPRHKGNERILINPDDLRLEGDTTSSGELNPSACSKAIAVYMKDLVSTPTGAARRHRWNINVKLNLTGLTTNNSIHRSVDLQQLFDGGIISTENPIEPGKFLLAIKNQVFHPDISKHLLNH